MMELTLRIVGRTLFGHDVSSHTDAVRRSMHTLTEAAIRPDVLLIWTYFPHREPRWYPEPEAFSPERFGPEARAELPQQAYLPFGAGSRTCIGKSFAMIEAALILATLARRYRLRLAPGQRVALGPRVTLARAHGMPMRLEPRAGCPSQAARRSRRSGASKTDNPPAYSLDIVSCQGCRSRRLAEKQAPASQHEGD